MTKIKTFKQLETAWNELREEILSRPVFLDNSDTAKTGRKKGCKNNIAGFGKTYFPDYMPAEPAPFHKEWGIIRKIVNEPVQVQAFRGAGKSTYFSLIEPIHEICYGNRKFMIFSSYTEEKSAVFTGRILLELLYNQRLINDFGLFFPEGRKVSIKRFSANIPDTAGEKVGVRAVSIGQDPRGLVHGPNRPDYVRLDDIQNRKRAKSRKFVKDSIDWIMKDLIPALAEDFSAVVLSTPLNTRCVASQLEKGSEDIAPVRTFKFPAEHKGKPTWKAAFPEKRLKAIKKVIGSLSYGQEYLLIPTSLDERIFSEDSIKYYNPDELLSVRFAYIFSWTDPSIKKEEHHCYKATICAGITGEGIIYVLSARIRKESVSRMVEGMYLIYNALNPSWMYWEDNGGQGLLAEVLNAKAEREGYHLPHRAQTNSLNKETRIEGTLSAPIENGIIHFNRQDPDQKLLVEQLLQFPDSEFKDGPDALEGVTRKLFEYARKSRAGKPVSALPRQAPHILRGY